MKNLKPVISVALFLLSFFLFAFSHVHAQSTVTIENVGKKSNIGALPLGLTMA